METVLFRDLGKMGYKEAWEYQEELLQQAVRLKTEWRQGQAAVLESRGLGEIGTGKTGLGETGIVKAGAGEQRGLGEAHAGLAVAGERLASEAGTGLPGTGGTGVGEGRTGQVGVGEAGMGQTGDPGTIKTGAGETAGYNGPDTKHYLLFVEHPPVYTIGKSGHMENLLLDETVLAARGVGLFRTNRGGDITFHGPEQLVGYPVLDLERFYTDIGKYLRNLEEVFIRVLADYGIKGERSAGETGVWIEPGIKGKERKICAIGVRCSRWVTMHGFAFNVNTDLNYFNDIVPCGIVDKQVASLERELGFRVPMQEVQERVRREFEQVFGVRLV